jgi:hypothetical protein
MKRHRHSVFAPSDMGSVNKLAALNRGKAAKIIVDAIMVRVFIQHMQRN